MTTPWKDLQWQDLIESETRGILWLKRIKQWLENYSWVCQHPFIFCKTLNQFVSSVTIRLWMRRRRTRKGTPAVSLELKDLRLVFYLTGFPQNLTVWLMMNFPKASIWVSLSPSENTPLLSHIVRSTNEFSLISYMLSSLFFIFN